MQQTESDRLVQAAAADLAHGRYAQAALRLEAALVADPGHRMALTKQAELAVYQRDGESALALTEAVLAEEPHFAPAWHQRAGALWAVGRPDDAVRAAWKAVEIQPPNPEFRLRLGQFLTWTGGGAAAEAVLAPLLAAERHDPAGYAAALSRLGERAIAEGRFEAAFPYLDRALALHPQLAGTRMLRGMNQLRLGRYREGWADYAARESIPELRAGGAPPAAGRAWQGESLSGKSLLVVDDQGHGDAIQFFRYASLLRDRGAASITWLTFPGLVRLLAAAAPYVRVVPTVPEGMVFDLQCDSASLPRWLGTELDSIPPPWAYPRVRSPEARPWKGAGGGLRVGLAWSGDVRHTRDHLRSIPAAMFLTLADVPGIAFHSLQHVVRRGDRAAVEGRAGMGRAVERAADFADTAALIADLDLVIAVDTAVAHLAGTLGTPVWVVLHVAPDWRWLTGRTDSPWYSSARLFRAAPAEWLRPDRTASGGAGPGMEDAAGWGPVVQRVRTALVALAAGR